MSGDPMAPRGRLPQRPEYEDVPLWPHNFDNVQTRVVNAAWNALFETDFEDLSFKSLAKGIGVTPQAIYHYYPSLSSLGGELAYRGLVTLHSELTSETSAWEPRKPKSLEQVVAQYVGFAQKRRRHFALMFSPRFSDAELFPAVRGESVRLGRALFDLLEVEVGAEADGADLHVFWAIIHGSASLIASGHQMQPGALFLACQRQLEVLRLRPAPA